MDKYLGKEINKYAVFDQAKLLASNMKPHAEQLLERQPDENHFYLCKEDDDNHLA